jgi:hypothetical protein
MISLLDSAIQDVNLNYNRNLESINSDTHYSKQYEQEKYCSVESSLESKTLYTNP